MSVNFGNSLAPQTQNLSGLCTGLDLDLCFCIYGRNLHRSAQDGLRNRNIQVVYQIVSVPDQVLVGFLLDQHEQITVDASVTCGITLTADGKLHALAHSGRNPDLDHLFSTNDTLSVALRTR